MLHPQCRPSLEVAVLIASSPPVLAIKTVKIAGLDHLSGKIKAFLGVFLAWTFQSLEWPRIARQLWPLEWASQMQSEAATRLV